MVVGTGTTLVPVRAVSEGLGMQVDWDAHTQTVTLQDNNHSIQFAIGELVPGMLEPAQLVNGRTMVPLRFIAEQLGALVSFEAETGMIEILR